MEVVSVCVGTRRTVRWRGKSIETGIFKEAVAHSVRLRTDGVDGDVQVDRRYHGGTNKAVYAYAAEHYPFWAEQLGQEGFPWGAFGENLTVAGGLMEEDICVGDRFAAGSALLVAAEPRLPCFKLGIRFGTQRIVKPFARSGRYGVYFRVEQEGMIEAGNTIERISANPVRVSIADLGRMLLGFETRVELIRQAIMLEGLSEDHQNRLRSTLP